MHPISKLYDFVELTFKSFIHFSKYAVSELLLAAWSKRKIHRKESKYVTLRRRKWATHRRIRKLA